MSDLARASHTKRSIMRGIILALLVYSGVTSAGLIEECTTRGGTYKLDGFTQRFLQDAFIRAFEETAPKGLRLSPNTSVKEIGGFKKLNREELDRQFQIKGLTLDPKLTLDRLNAKDGAATVSDMINWVVDDWSQIVCGQELKPES